MRRRFAATITSLAASLVAAACTLTVSTTGLTGGDGTPAPDAADDTTADAPAAETSTDSAVDAPLGPFCSRAPHTVCEDFDDPSRRLFSKVLLNGGTVADDGDAASPPFSALCDVPPSVTENTSARLSRDLTGVPANIRVAFDFKAASASNSGFVEVFKLEMSNTFESEAVGYGDAAISIGSDRGNWNAYRFGYLAGGGTNRYDEAHPISNLGSGSFRHVEVEAKLATSGGTLRVTIDGTKVVDATGIRTLTEGATGVRLVIGVYTNGVPTPYRVRIDNIAIDAS